MVGDTALVCTSVCTGVGETLQTLPSHRQPKTSVFLAEERHSADSISIPYLYFRRMTASFGPRPNVYQQSECRVDSDVRSVLPYVHRDRMDC